MALIVHVLKKNFNRNRKRKLNDFVQASLPSLKVARFAKIIKTGKRMVRRPEDSEKDREDVAVGGKILQMTLLSGRTGKKILKYL